MYGCWKAAGLKLSSRPLAWLLAAALGMVSGCTDPVFRPAPEPDASFEVDTGTPVAGQSGDLPDTGVVAAPGGACEGAFCSGDGDAEPLDAAIDAAASDAGPADDAGDAALDEARAKWAGRYATRSALFTFDDPIRGSARLLTLAEIVPTPEGGLRLDEELCYFEGDWTFFFTGVLTYRFSGARGSVPLQYDRDTFSSEQMTLRIGYGPTPAGCSPGATMPRSEEQTWLTSTCDCPRSDDPPTSLRDCRVSDPENDKEPGATFSAALDASPAVFRVAQEERVRLRAGFRRDERLHAERSFEDTTRILSCILNNGMATSGASCPVGSAKPCPFRHNKVEFVPLEEPLTCAQVISMESALFLSPLPDFPASCPSELAASAQRAR